MVAHSSIGYWRFSGRRKSEVPGAARNAADATVATNCGWRVQRPPPAGHTTQGVVKATVLPTKTVLVDIRTGICRHCGIFSNPIDKTPNRNTTIYERHISRRDRQGIHGDHVLTDQFTWSVDQRRHLIRVAMTVHRDPIYCDLFQKLEAHAG